MNSANYLRDTIDVVKQIETRFLELAARLFIIQKDKLWEGSYDSFSEFVDATGIKRPLATILVKIHQRYVVEGGVSPAKLAAAGYHKLYDAIPLLDESDAETVAAKARLLTVGELRQEVRDEKHPDCEHSETITICSKCHKRMDEHE